VIRCSRCDHDAPSECDAVQALIGDGQGDPSLLPVLTPPEGWIVDPDDDERVVCHGCATSAEAAAYAVEEHNALWGLTEVLLADGHVADFEERDDDGVG
jgi:hypothetical protein